MSTTDHQHRRMRGVEVTCAPGVLTPIRCDSPRVT
eukprot:COSAG02_NODE_66958_length_254_cov_0.664516_1_plen_34_part_01